MDLKEKILKENLLLIKDRNIQKNVGDRWVQFNSEKSTVAIYEAMDELSKIVAIAFAKWIPENAYIAEDEYFYKLLMNSTRVSEQELYELFTQSKEYKELMNS